MNYYEQFLESKKLVVPSVGIEVVRHELNKMLFAFQSDLVYWALVKGRSALFCDTGLGKTPMQLVWADVVHKHTGRDVLILAPLAVARQTVQEGAKFGVKVSLCRNQNDVKSGLNITNYEMVDHFEADRFVAVVLDESSLLKNFEGKTRSTLISKFARTEYKLCCTATPAPNDIQEICNHAEFLGIMTRTEMLAAFFVHDDNGWRLKGHAKKGPFWKWLASWSMAVKKPSDLGYSDQGYELPGLDIRPVYVRSNYLPDGKLFHDKLAGVTERAGVRKATIKRRAAKTVRLIQAQPDSSQWLVWCGLNDEGELLHKWLPGSVLVEGSQTPEQKADALTRFAAGETRIIVTKCSIAGYGLNFQSCHNMVFCGLGDSYEDYYQAIRRCYRFGQRERVNVSVVLSDIEDTIYQNVLRKEKEASHLSNELIKHVIEFEKAEIRQTGKENMTYMTKDAIGAGWKILLGDSAERLKELPGHSIDLAVFSPPFQNLYTYSNSERDLGNCKDPAQFWQHFSFISPELLRVMKPGRIVCCHVQQIATQKARDGEIGLFDFRGDTIKHFKEQGFVYHGEVCIDKDPQAQAIRTKSKALLFTQFHKDSSWSRPALADYILLFRAPGENAVPVHPDVTNNEWIEYARPIWYGIKETDTLNVVEARSEEDERHICPLQLGTIERCIKLWSNPGETVLDPFNGIGSTGYEAILTGRKYLGVELNPVYFQVAVKNLEKAENETKQVDLFSLAGIVV